MSRWQLRWKDDNRREGPSDYDEVDAICDAIACDVMMLLEMPRLLALVKLLTIVRLLTMDRLLAMARLLAMVRLLAMSRLFAMPKLLAMARLLANDQIALRWSDYLRGLTQVYNGRLLQWSTTMYRWRYPKHLILSWRWHDVARTIGKTFNMTIEMFL